MNNQKEYSTSALAKEMNKYPQDLFQQLADMGFIMRREMFRIPGQSRVVSSITKLVV
jgi:hypothetical protein